MRKELLHFALNDWIAIEGRHYIIKGKINFLNETDNCNWTEYKIVDQNSPHKNIWLSIDMVYHEYAIYEKTSKMTAEQVKRKGYHLVDQGLAKVMDLEGDVDVDYGDQVLFEEYEDRTKEKIIALERWENEVECSMGYYLDADEITRVSAGYHSKKQQENRGKKRGKLNIASLVIVGLLFIGIFGSLNIFGNTNLSNEIRDNNAFTYVTSITADLDNKQKADVYETSLTIEAAAKQILQMAGKSVESVDENAEDQSVAIITKTHYCLIYQDNDGRVLIQVSTRRYVYSSRQQLYHSRSGTYDFYRGYYYSTGYFKDDKKYNDVDAYEDYSGSFVTTDCTNRYQTYSDTIKQESIASRSSSGGGTSSGK